MHVSDFLAAAVQLTSGQDPELNFNAAEEQIDLAARRGAELIGLPENFAFMGRGQPATGAGSHPGGAEQSLPGDHGASLSGGAAGWWLSCAGG